MSYNIIKTIDYSLFKELKNLNSVSRFHSTILEITKLGVESSGFKPIKTQKGQVKISTLANNFCQLLLSIPFSCKTKEDNFSLNFERCIQKFNALTYKSLLNEETGEIISGWQFFREILGGLNLVEKYEVGVHSNIFSLPEDIYTLMSSAFEEIQSFLAGKLTDKSQNQEIMEEEDIEKIDTSKQFLLSSIKYNSEQRAMETLGKTKTNLMVLPENYLENLSKNLKEVCESPMQALRTYSIIKKMKDEAQYYDPKKKAYASVIDIEISQYGRLNTKGRGFINLPKPVKKVLCKSLAEFYGTQVTNFDINGCHPSICMSLSDRYGMSKLFPNLARLVNERSRIRSEITKRTGIDNQTVKDGIAGILYNAKLSDTWNFDSIAIPTMLKSRGYSREQYQLFRKELMIFKQEFDLWNREIAPRFVKDMKQSDGTYSNGVTRVQPDFLISRWETRKVPYWKFNPAKGIKEKHFNEERLPVLKKEAITWILQGQEMNFILCLLESKHCDFEVLSYEYDGLIIKGSVSKKCLADAKVRSGLRRLDITQDRFNQFSY